MNMQEKRSAMWPMTIVRRFWRQGKRLKDELRRLLHDRSGSLIATFAIAAPVILGVVGFGVETGLWYAEKRELQTQADSAALSGAYERAKGRPSNVTAAAMREATRNGFVDTPPNTASVNNPPSSGPASGEPEAVEVILSKKQSLLLMSVIADSLTISARAVGMVQTTGTACVLALDPSVSGALTNTGNPTLNMTGCVMAANSTSSSAIDITGSADVTAESLWTAGGYTHGGSASVTLNTSPTVNAWALDDPYADLTIPPLGACDYNNFSSNTTMTLNPGVYCNGFSAQSSAVLTLNPGTYYIDGGDFRVQGGATITCNCVPGTSDGVTIVLTSSVDPSLIGSVDIRGGANVVLRAPKTGLFAGVLFYQDRRATSTTVSKFNGGAGMQLTGALYVPSHTLQYSGNNESGGANCTQIIGKQVEFVGNAYVSNTGCPAAGVEPLKIVGVKVVE